MSTTISSSTSSSSLPIPPSDSPIWTNLLPYIGNFRHAHAKSSPESSSRFLQISIQPLDEIEKEDKPLADDIMKSITKEKLYEVFSPFGDIDGILLTAHTERNERNPPRTMAYIAFKLKYQAARAWQILHKKGEKENFKGISMHLHHVIEKHPTKNLNNENGENNNQTTNNTVPSVPPTGLYHFPSFLTREECDLISSTSSTKGPISYGIALPEEDDKFGLKKPSKLDENIWGDILKKVENIDLNKGISKSEEEITKEQAESKDSTSNPNTNESVSSSGPIASTSTSSSTSSVPLPLPSIPSFNRMTVSILSPGQGLKPCRDPPHLFGSCTLLMNVGPIDTHILIELLPLGSREKKWGIIIKEGGIVLLTGPSRYECEYGITGRTRDQLTPLMASNKYLFLMPTGGTNSTHSVNMKRTKTILCIGRYVLANPLPTPQDYIMSKNSIKLSLKEAKLTKEEEEEKKEKKIQSTAIVVPKSSTTNASNTNPSISSSSSSSDISANEAAARMEDLHVRGVYDSIASHFSSTRHSPWPRVEKFIENLPAGLHVADIGCGNGKYMKLNPHIYIKGCDNSKKLVEICRNEKGLDVIYGDLMNIPFPSITFDAVICIAVLHHISTIERRLRGINELIRILKPGGTLLVSAWAYEQDQTSRREFPSQDVLVPWVIPKAYLKNDNDALEISAKTMQAQKEAQEKYNNNNNNNNNMDGNNNSQSIPSSSSTDSIPSSSPPPPPSSSPSLTDIDPSSGLPLIHFHRYCHVYHENELENLFEKNFKLNDEIIFIDRYYDRGNWCVIVKKLKEIPRIEKKEEWKG